MHSGESSPSFHHMFKHQAHVVLSAKNWDSLSGTWMRHKQGCGQWDTRKPSGLHTTQNGDSLWDECIFFSPAATSAAFSPLWGILEAVGLLEPTRMRTKIGVTWHLPASSSPTESQNPSGQSHTSCGLMNILPNKLPGVCLDTSACAGRNQSSLRLSFLPP